MHVLGSVQCFISVGWFDVFIVRRLESWHVNWGLLLL